MSPKRAVPKVKAKAKARARGALRGLHRPAAVVYRRPGAREAEPPVVAKPEDDFRGGRSVPLWNLPLDVFKVGSRIVVSEGSYFEGPCQVAGRLREVNYGEGGGRLKLLMTGTSNEELLRYATGMEEKIAEVHMCPVGCTGEPHAPGLVHARKGHTVTPGQEATLTWEKNLEVSEMDELAKLRELQRATPPGIPREDAKKKDKEAKKARSSSSSRSAKKRKKSKRKKKSKKEDDRGERSPVEEAEGEAKKKSKRRRTRAYGGRTVAKKDVAMIYGGAGMDPRSKIRRKVTAYARRKVRRKKDSSSSTSLSSGEGSSSTSTEEADDAMQDQGRVRQTHRHAPGLLMSQALQRMASALTEVEGLWNRDEGSLLPVALRYTRSQLGNKLSGAALKEAITLASSVDLMAQGRVAEAGDYLVQRLKSLEKICQGVSWQTSERLELAPSLAPQISSLAEVQAAKKEAKLDQDHNKGSTPAWGAKGNAGKGSKKGKTEDKGKGKRKEAQQKPGGGTG